MASDSQTATPTISEKPLENKVDEEAKLMEKEIILPETADVMKDKQVSDSDLTVTKEENIIQTPACEAEKEPHVDVEEVVSVVKADENGGEKKVAEEVELKESAPVKQSVEEVKVEAADAEKAEENGEEKVAEQVELIEPILVKEGVEEIKLETLVDVEKEEEKQTVESVAEEGNNKDKEETKVVDVSASTDEAGDKQVEQVDVQVPEETVQVKVKDVEVLEVEPKIEADKKDETQPEKENELAPSVEVVTTEEKTPETTEEAKVELEGKLEATIVVETKDSGLNSKDEQTSVINQDSDAAPKKETRGEASSPADVTEKSITEEKHVVDEPSKDEQENASEAKDVLTKVATEVENIKKDTETPAADMKSEETLKETEGNKQEVTEKVAEVVETAPVVKEIEEPEVTTKEVAVKPKNSNSIMSKVKKSLVKAKKAIIGKSPSSKTITTQEAKEEIKAK